MGVVPNFSPLFISNPAARLSRDAAGLNYDLAPRYTLGRRTSLEDFSASARGGGCHGSTISSLSLGSPHAWSRLGRIGVVDWSPSQPILVVSTFSLCNS